MEGKLFLRLNQMQVIYLEQDRMIPAKVSRGTSGLPNHFWGIFSENISFDNEFVSIPIMGATSRAM